MKRTFANTVLGLLLLFMLFILVGEWLDRAPILLFGWVPFLKRNVPKMNWDPGLIATGVICTAALLLLGHWFLRLLFHQAQALGRTDTKKVIPWRKRWTASLYCGIWLLFMIAFGASGLFRHITWLRAYDKPWYRASNHSCIAYLRQIDGAIEQWALEYKKKAGDPVVFTGTPSILDYIKGGEFPSCPNGGTIRVSIVGEPPTCTEPGHTLP